MDFTWTDKRIQTAGAAAGTQQSALSVCRIAGYHTCSDDAGAIWQLILLTVHGCAHTQVGPALQVAGFSNIFAVGDINNVPETKLVGGAVHVPECAVHVNMRVMFCW